METDPVGGAAVPALGPQDRLVTAVEKIVGVPVSAVIPRMDLKIDRRHN